MRAFSSARMRFVDCGFGRAYPYEQFGDDLTNEMVNWMNQVDATYRSEFRDLFEVHFGRLDARLEQHSARTDAKLEQMKSDLVRWNFLFWIGTLGTVVALLKL